MSKSSDMAEVAADFSLPPRLGPRASFVAVQNTGKRWSGRFMVLLAAPCGSGRVGYTVSRKVGNAVTRNRVRRRLREIIRHHPQLLEPTCDLVIIAYTRASKASFAALRHDCLRLLRRASSVWDSMACLPPC